MANHISAWRLSNRATTIKVLRATAEMPVASSAPLAADDPPPSEPKAGARP
jgi:hypothetical protein